MTIDGIAALPIYAGTLEVKTQKTPFAMGGIALYGLALTVIAVPLK
jgi:hypothetical protein